VKEVHEFFDMTKEELDREIDMKKQAHDYSVRFINRKTNCPDSKLALAFEAGYKAALVDKNGDVE